VKSSAFLHCNPTCTNAALSIGHSLGFRRIYLFGTDYGYKSEKKDHADYSAHGAKARSVNALKYRKRLASERRASFRVPAASGSGTVLTRNDYYAAKRYVEVFYREISEAHPNSKLFNCSDGAEIEGVPWVSSKEFIDIMAAGEGGDGPNLEELFAGVAQELPEESLDDAMRGVIAELRKEVEVFLRLLTRARLQGRKDLCLLANEVRGTARTIKARSGASGVSPAQSYVSQLLMGTLMHFVLVGLTHGLACNDSELPNFLKLWREEFKAFLEKLPDHFSGVVAQGKSRGSDPWTRLNFNSAEPGD